MMARSKQAEEAIMMAKTPLDEIVEGTAVEREPVDQAGQTVGQDGQRGHHHQLVWS